MLVHVERKLGNYAIAINYLIAVLKMLDSKVNLRDTKSLGSLFDNETGLIAT